MELTFLGTGTSHGVPVIGCDCKVCKSLSKKNKRNRASVYIKTQDGKYILIDIGPEFRLEAIKYNVKKIDALLLTHSHADHLHGIDDIRIFSCDCFKRTERNAEILDAPPIPIYTNEPTIEDLKSRFAYFFSHPSEGGGHAKVEVHNAKAPFQVGSTTVTPIPMMHGHCETTGWLLTEPAPDGTKQSIAYLTDCSYISDESIALIRKEGGAVRQLVIDGLREQPHSTHFSFLEAMETAEKIGAERVWLTHLTHHHSHSETKRYLLHHRKDFPSLTKHLSPAWDGLRIHS